MSIIAGARQDDGNPQDKNEKEESKRRNLSRGRELQEGG